MMWTCSVCLQHQSRFQERIWGRSRYAHTTLESHSLSLGCDSDNNPGCNFNFIFPCPAYSSLGVSHIGLVVVRIIMLGQCGSDTTFSFVNGNLWLNQVPIVHKLWPPIFDVPSRASTLEHHAYRKEPEKLVTFSFAWTRTHSAGGIWIQLVHFRLLVIWVYDPYRK